MALGKFWGVMLGAWDVISRSSRLLVWKRRLLGAVAVGALPLLTSPGPAWGQVSETLPEVTVTAPKKTTPKPARRTAPAPARPAGTRPVASRPAPSPPAPAPAVTTPSPFHFVPPTPITALAIHRHQLPAIVPQPPAGA